MHAATILSRALLRRPFLSFTHPARRAFSYNMALNAASHNPAGEKTGPVSGQPPAPSQDTKSAVLEAANSDAQGLNAPGKDGGEKNGEKKEKTERELAKERAKAEKQAKFDEKMAKKKAQAAQAGPKKEKKDEADEGADEPSGSSKVKKEGEVWHFSNQDNQRHYQILTMCAGG